MGKLDSKSREYFGRKLFPLIQNINPNQAGKITGILLMNDSVVLLELLNSPAALLTKVKEIEEFQIHYNSKSRTE